MLTMMVCCGYAVSLDMKKRVRTQVKGGQKE